MQKGEIVMYHSRVHNEHCKKIYYENKKIELLFHLIKACQE